MTEVHLYGSTQRNARFTQDDGWDGMDDNMDDNFDGIPS